jgi:DnaD/phage-associated family protein
MRFSGFDKGTLFTPVPNPLFGPLLEQIQDLAELKVTLRGLWMLHRQRQWPHAVSAGAFLSDTALLRGLRGFGQEPTEEIRRGLQLAVARGTFLLHRPKEERGAEPVYLLNNHAGRSALARMRHDSSVSPQYTPETMPEEPPAEPLNIFALYENNIGTISPLLVDQLTEAEEDYPWTWINQAFQIAVAENKRSWRYIAGILRRWAAEGKDNGKPERHPAEDSRQEFLRDYQRRWGSSGEDRART